MIVVHRPMSELVVWASRKGCLCSVDYFVCFQGKCDPEIIAAKLDLYSSSCPHASQIANYWLCRARIAQQEKDFDRVVCLLEQAFAFKAQVIQLFFHPFMSISSPNLLSSSRLLLLFRGFWRHPIWGKVGKDWTIFSEHFHMLPFRFSKGEPLAYFLFWKETTSSIFLSRYVICKYIQNHYTNIFMYIPVIFTNAFCGFLFSARVCVDKRRALLCEFHRGKLSARYVLPCIPLGDHSVVKNPT